MAGQRWHRAASVSFRSCLQFPEGPSDMRPAPPPQSKEGKGASQHSSQHSRPTEKGERGWGDCQETTKIHQQDPGLLALEERITKHLSIVYEKTEKDGGTSGDTFLLFAYIFYVLYTKHMLPGRVILKTGPGCPVLPMARALRQARGGLAYLPETCTEGSSLPPGFADIRGTSFSRRWS